MLIHVLCTTLAYYNVHSGHVHGELFPSSHTNLNQRGGGEEREEGWKERERRREGGGGKE